MESRGRNRPLWGMQEEEVSTLWFIDARCTWKPYARYLAWRWKRKGYRTAYQPVTLCKALVGSIDYTRSGE